ncbi:MAG: M14 family metallopeptidase [archaeon GB-1867-035]|nr:M14 family metallopeptidase [Candidatus Culexmicrobium profundum]
MSKSKIPKSEEFLGFKIGEDKKLANWNQIVEYFKKIGELSDRVKVEVLGLTTEGNEFILATISAPDNLRNLEKYRKIQMKLHNPEGLSEEEAEKLIEEGKTIVLVTCSIHSTEIAASQMSMELLYKLATENSEEVKEILDNIIFLLVPSLNPDGIIKVVEWYKKTLETKYEGSRPPYMYHKYVGHDNNRDWFMFTQVETRLAVEKIHNLWHPQIVYDLHQMGSYGARFWLPPFIDPIDPNVDPILQQEIVFLGSSMANELIGKGKKGVACHTIFDAWTPARAYQHYHGGVRILSEAASVKIATPIEIKKEELEERRGFDPKAQRWNNPNPWLGGKWTLRDIIDYELIAVMACLRNAAKYRKIWLYNTLQIFKKALNPEKGPYAFLIPPNQRDLYNTYWLLEILKTGDVKIHKAKKEFEAEGITYPAGTYIIYYAQPYGCFAKTLLEVQKYPELKEAKPYDLTAWTLPLLMDVKVITVNKKFEAEVEEVAEVKMPSGKIVGDEKAKYYAFTPKSNASYKLAATLLKEGFKVKRATKPIKVDNEELPAGAFIVTGNEKTRERISQLLKELPIKVYALNEIPTNELVEIKLPRIGIYQSWFPIADEGWTRFILEKFGYPFETIHDKDIRRGKLNDRFDVIIIPSQKLENIIEGRKEEDYPPEYCGGIGEIGVENLNNFVINGGTLITLNQSCMLPIKKMWIPVSNALEGVSEEEFYVPGAILRAIVDNKHPIGYGMPIDAAVLFVNSPAFKCQEKYVVARYPPTNPLLSGYILGDKYLHNLAAIVDIPKGKGRIILFGTPVQFRCQTPGTFKMLFNALLYPQK